MSEERFVKITNMLLYGSEEDKRVLSKVYPQIAKTLNDAGMNMVLRFVYDFGITEGKVIIFPVHHKGESFDLEITIKKK